MTEPSSLLRAAEADLAWMLASLEALVRSESPSDDKAAVDRCVDVLAALGRDAGARVDRIAVAAAGDHLRLAFGPPPGAAPVRLLVLGHTDTVWPIGTLAAMPVERRDGALHGPGVYDMKAGLVIGLQALRLLGSVSTASVVMLATGDEEVGSATSRALIEAEARAADAVLVLEPALEQTAPPMGGVKIGRKGVGEFRLEVTGVPAHAGLEPEKGASAVQELARQLIAIQNLARPDLGTTLNAGVIAGGTRGNVVAERAWAAIDVRVTAMEEATRIEQALTQLVAADPRISLRVSGRVNRPPLDRTDADRPAASGAPRTEISPQPWGYRRSTAWARSAPARMRGTSTSASTRCRCGRRSSPASSIGSVVRREGRPPARPSPTARMLLGMETW